MGMYAVPNYQQQSHQQTHVIYQQYCERGFENRVLQQQQQPQYLERFLAPRGNAHHLLQVSQQEQN